MTVEHPRTAEERRAYRAFLRSAHPDLGGDPDAFVDGLAQWRTRTPPGRPTTAPSTSPFDADRPLFHHRRRGPGVFLDWFLDIRRRRRRPPRVH